MTRFLLPLLAASLLLIAAKPVAPDPVVSLNESDPHLGDTIVFSYVAPDHVKDDCTNRQCLRIQLVCFQGAQPVYSEQELALDNHFLLGGVSSFWIDFGGPAECDVTLYRWTQQLDFIPYATMSFHAEGAR